MEERRDIKISNIFSNEKYLNYGNVKGKDYKSIAWFARRHKLLELFYYETKKNKEIESSTEDVEEVKKIVFYKTIKNKSHSNQIEHLYKKFNEKGVKVIALKGAVIRNYYIAPDLRNMCDCDLLVKESDMKEVQEILINEGYYYRSKTEAHLVYYHKDYKPVELHSTILTENFKKKSPYGNDLFKSMREVKIGGETAYGLCCTEQLIHLVTHMMTHFAGSNIGFRHILDIALYIEGEKENIDFIKFKNVMEECKLYKFSLVVLKSCEELFKLDLPKVIKKDLNKVSSKVKDSFIHFIFADGMGVAIAPLYKITDGGDRKTLITRYIQFLFPSQQFMIKRNEDKDVSESLKKVPKVLLPIAWINRVITGGSKNNRTIIYKLKKMNKGYRITKKKNELIKQLDM